jgi:putative peptidoglycan lipid II flippase
VDSSSERGIPGRTILLAVSTLIARASGYLRVVALASTLGVGLLANAYGTANAFPNMVFELLVGGGLRSVLVPTLVHEFERDRESGWRTASAIFNLIVLGLTAVTVVAVIAAPQIFRLLTFGSSVPATDRFRQVGTIFLALMIPQVVFYGMDLVTTGVLNAHRRFASPVLFVLLGNAVTIGAFLAYMAVRGSGPSLQLGAIDYVLLGGGTTAGVATIGLAGMIAVRRLRPVYRFVLGHGVEAVRRAVRAAGWMFVYVLANQIGLVVVLVLGNRVVGGVAAYQYAFMLFMLPYTVVGLSLTTTMLPEISSHAVARDLSAVSRLVSKNLTWALALLGPASILLLVASEPLVSLLYGYGAVGSADVAFVASVAAAFGAGLLPFTVFQVLARAHYAFHDTRTPALVNLAAVAVNIAVDIVLFYVLDGRTRVVGLAIGHAISYALAAGTLWLVTARRLPGVRVRLEPAALSPGRIRAGLTGRVPTARRAEHQDVRPERTDPR